MIDSLEKNNFLVIPNFISKERSKLLKEDFESYCEQNNIGGDNHVPQSHSLDNYVSFLELLCEKTPTISNIIGESVLPTYCYGRVYKKGGTLSSHRDRPSCEISISLHLGGDDQWNFCVESPNKKINCFELSPGDAILYLGNRAHHYREGTYKGNNYTQIFFHYIRSRGEYFNHYFDYIVRNMIVEEIESDFIEQSTEKIMFQYS
jgi:hypothetical protein